VVNITAPQFEAGRDLLGSLVEIVRAWPRAGVLVGAESVAHLANAFVYLARHRDAARRQQLAAEEVQRAASAYATLMGQERDQLHRQVVALERQLAKERAAHQRTAAERDELAQLAREQADFLAEQLDAPDGCTVAVMVVELGDQVGEQLGEPIG
jgi:hypothetical protein